MSLRLERSYPYWAGAVAGVASSVIFFSQPLPSTATDVLTAIVSLAGIFTGFLSAAEAILISVDDRPVIQGLKQADGFTQLVRYLHAAAAWSMLLAVVSVVCLAIDLGDLPLRWWSLLAGGWMFSAVVAICATYRVLHLFRKIMLSGQQ